MYIVLGIKAYFPIMLVYISRRSRSRSDQFFSKLNPILHCLFILHDVALHFCVGGFYRSVRGEEVHAAKSSSTVKL